MLRSGLDLSGARLALAAASHSGEPFQLDLVRKMLAEHGLTEVRPAVPARTSPWTRARRRRTSPRGRTRARSRGMNCSGKHAAMLAACAQRAGPLETYLDPDHPLQQLIARHLEAPPATPSRTPAWTAAARR